MSTPDEKKAKEDLANARRKLKKFRDQHPNGNAPPVPVPQPADPLHLPFEQFLLQRTLSPFDIADESSPVSSADSARRPAEPDDEQTELHVQTIGILVAEKADLAAKLSQSLKQLERKQCEIDELFGRLKASRERIEQLEKDLLNSTSSVQKRELAAKESEKENIQLKVENIRLSQMVEDWKQKCEERASSSSSAATGEPSQSDELNRPLEKRRESSARSPTECLETIGRLEEEKSGLLARIERLESSVAELSSGSASSVDADRFRRLSEENESLKGRLADQDHLIVQLQSETDTIGDYIQLYHEQRQQLQKRAEENDLLVQQLSAERCGLQMKEWAMEDFLVGLASRLAVDGTELRRIFAAFVEWRRKDEATATSPAASNGDGTSRQAFAGDEGSHLCSTCRGPLQRI